jgi:glycosyltransferase involved in cell wall biosynthesis
MKASVVICTRNPKPSVFDRVLESLAAQTIPASEWELVIVDNGSIPAVSTPTRPGLRAARVVVEPRPGLTYARIQGIRESRGDVIVFVDDDNLLDPDYLETALGVAEAFPRIGVFGGRISGHFATSPPEWLLPFLSHLAVIDLAHDEWSNLADDRAVLPCGAGLCVRRSAAHAWAAAVAGDPRRLVLGRSGERTLACEDTDLVLTCLDHGHGSGRFRALHLTHVIPASRLDFGYNLRLAGDIGWSWGRLQALRGRSSTGRRLIALGKAVLAWLGVTHRGRARRLDVAYHWGVWRGLGESTPRDGTTGL